MVTTQSSCIAGCATEELPEFLSLFFKVQEFCLISVVSSHTSCLHVCYFCVDKEEETDRSSAEQESEESWTKGASSATNV